MTDSCVSLMRDFLIRQGFAISIAYDGLTGLAMASQEPHDLVLLDVVLPGLGGFAVLDELRRGERYSCVDADGAGRAERSRVRIVGRRRRLPG